MVMENQTLEAMIISVSIALPVAVFPLNSDRVQKVIELCSECLILLSNINQNSKDQPNSPHYSATYKVLFCAYRRISDYINAERYGRNLLVLCIESCALLEEGDISMALAEIVKSQKRFREAKHLYERTIEINRQIGEKVGEANTPVQDWEVPFINLATI